MDNSQVIQTIRDSIREDLKNATWEEDGSLVNQSFII